MNNFRKLIIAALIIGVSLLALPLTVSAETVKVAQFGKEKFLLYLPLYIAMEEGYFKENGLDIDLIFAGNDDQIFAAVAGGSADFGVGDPVFNAIAQEKGFEAKTVALMITNLGISGYTNNPDIPVITKPEDLAGLRVGSFPKPSTTYTLLDEMIRNHPETLKDTKIVEAGFGAQVALIEADQADIAVDLEPTVSKVEAQGYRVVFNVSDYIDQQAITGLMVTQETIDEKAETVQGMVNGLQKALTVMHKDRAVALKVAKKLFPDLGDTVIENAVERMMAQEMYPQSAVMPDEYWQRTLKTRLETGELKEEQPTSKTVDNQFALKANEGK